MKYKCIDAAQCEDMGLVLGDEYEGEIVGNMMRLTIRGKEWHLDTGRFVPAEDAPPRSPAVSNNALRFNAGKPEMHYADMFPLALAEVCRTLEYGTKRPKNPYPRFNWCKGAPFLELYNCARRHMLSWLKGETMDADAKEQGFEINNLAFTCGNLLRLLEQELSGRKDLDDRYKP